eukprot:TRINITY_DN786_c0_g3_i1.p1 TRINITY_DN786_c0_g3~~TRINITY_DN786_c0_g3_i1.p1  ORF type:complete len:287 (-),score=82.45 TRINITY_DN786_c0_g3_i1:94-954(-)
MAQISVSTVPLTDENVQQVYSWVDGIPLSRPKRNITRDFSDGVLTAEVTKHYFPKLVELHNYSTANSTSQKFYNWNTLNQKVFKKLGFMLSKNDVDLVVNCHPGTVEQILLTLKGVIEAKLEKKAAKEQMMSEISQISEASRYPQQGFPDETIQRMSQIQISQNPPPSIPQSKIQYQTIPPVQQQHQQQPPSKHGPSQVPTQPQQQAPPAQMPPQPQPFNPSLFDRFGVPDLQVKALLDKKDQQIKELQEHVETLETRLQKMEQIIRIKDNKIQKMTQRMQQAGIM